MSVSIKKRRVLKRKKLPALRTLRNRLDKLFSEFIRRRGAVRGRNECVSCGARMHWKKLQCGHFYRYTHVATRWDEDNCWPQCYACNLLRKGNYGNYAHFMYNKYTIQEMDVLHAKAQMTVKVTRSLLMGHLDRVGRLLLNLSAK